MLPTDTDGRPATAIKVVVLALGIAVVAAVAALPSLWVSAHVSPAIGVPLGVLLATTLGGLPILVIRRRPGP